MNQHRAHLWGPPPPGSAGESCQSCGMRKAVALATGDEECKGVQQGDAYGDRRDYDPYEE
jgi:hypothetical protein